MIDKIFKALFGTYHERELKRITPLVSKINSLEKEIKRLSDDEMRLKTIKFKEFINNARQEKFKGKKVDPIEEFRFEQDILNQILPEAFALVREASVRTLNMRHFDVQLIGGIVLHEGKIAEMKTGEGKTLVATLPAYLNALCGKGVHIVTVNEYLAKRDTEWMGKIYRFLGLTAGTIIPQLTDTERKTAYNCDITYGHNSEIGFDYLRDNMKFSLDDYVQREHYYAIVDEVDCILIDEARTPLIISGPSEESTDIYYRANSIVKYLKPAPSEDEKERNLGDFWVDEKSKNVIMNESGIEKAEKLLGVDNLYDPSNIELLHALQQALRAHMCFEKEKDYIVKDGEVMIVDDFTGRIMEGRRWSDGLHQAIEAKEGVAIQAENQTLATITYQNYFRLYKKLAGMTGTADTEAEEFKKIYNLSVNVIPTNKPMIRKDYQDAIFVNEKSKFDAVVNEIIECYEKGQPVLVGTISIEKSEKLSEILKKRGIPHNVLNAKHHEKEAYIVAQAGRYKAVTIATNMAGRGTDILLGGNPEMLARQEVNEEENPEEFKRVLQEYKKICAEEREKVIESGGLHIIGTERHESRRIDNQLRGRSGRQGDPGSSRFFVSLEDDLMRMFGGDSIKGAMSRFGMNDGQHIEHKWLSRAIENAQKKVEAHNFEIRKHLLEYDDVMNQQRKTIYNLRRSILGSEDIRELILKSIDEYICLLVDTFCPEKVKIEEWDIKGLQDKFFTVFDVNVNLSEASVRREDYEDILYDAAIKRYEEKEKEITPDIMRKLEQYIYLQILDDQWRDHLLTMDHLREGIGLRGYGQKDPKIEYKREGYAFFLEMLDRIRENLLSKLMKIKIAQKEEKEIDRYKPKARKMNIGPAENTPQKPVTVVKGKKIGRNDPCPCGSGKKYKYCCMAKDEAAGKI